MPFFASGDMDVIFTQGGERVPKKSFLIMPDFALCQTVFCYKNKAYSKHTPDMLKSLCNSKRVFFLANNLRGARGDRRKRPTGR